MEEFDYIIVGAGSAGCVLARRLAETGKATVCLIEAGPADRNIFIGIPAGYIKNVMNPKLTWGFTSAPVPGIGGRRVGLVQGKAVGGSSSINGMVYNRGQAADYDGWAQSGNRGWSYDDVLPYFKKAETRIGGGDPAYRGNEGPLLVTDPAFEHPLLKMFISAAQGLGAKSTEDYTGPEQDGVGAFQFTIDRSGRRPVRASTARVYLRPALRTGRVSLRTNTYVARILFEQRRATGVSVRVGGPNGKAIELRARREVILSAGALNTPRLLQLSGIGSAEHLGGLGIDALTDLRGVGENLHDHYQIRLAARLQNIRTVNERSRGLPLVIEVMKWMVGGQSILNMGPVPMRLFTRSRPGLESPDLQMSFTPASFREGTAGLLDTYPGMTCGGYLQRPVSRGWVRVTSTDLAVQPEVQPNYLADESDMRATVSLFQQARAILASPAFRPYFVGEEFPGASVQSADEILDFIRSYGGTAFHHVGTARMGLETDPRAVVDHRLCVHGIGGLRVVDASVMPSIISGNTNAPTIMIAEKAADMILADAAVEA